MTTVVKRPCVWLIWLLLFGGCAGAWAQAPNLASATAADPDNGDNYFSVYDQLVLVFDVATNRAGFGVGVNLTKAQVDGMFTFSASLGSNYTGVWAADNKTFTITIQNIGTNGNPTIGVTTAASTGTIKDATATFASTTTPVAFAGNWGTASASPFAGGSGAGDANYATTSYACVTFYLGGTSSGFSGLRTTTLTCNSPFAGGSGTGDANTATTLYSCTNIFLGGQSSGFATVRTTTLTCNSPFAGGTGTGDANMATTLYTCSNIYLGGTASGYQDAQTNTQACLTAFGGGSGSGDANTATTLYTCTNIFLGGQASGYQDAQTNTQACLTAFGGGSGSGDANIATTLYNCGNIFLGGQASGYQDVQTNTQSCLSAFGGGSGSGSDSATTTLYACVSLYTGGQASGYQDVQTSTQTCLSAFGGGSGSGEDNAATTLYACVNLYTGGQASGYQDVQTNTQACLSAFGGGNGRGDANTATTLYACTNIFLGGQASGYQDVQTTSLACDNPFSGGSSSGVASASTSTAPCTNIFLGGQASGFQDAQTHTLACASPFNGGSGSGFDTAKVIKVAGWFGQIDYACINGTTRLSVANASSYPAGTTFEWHNAPTGGTLLGTGTTYTDNAVPTPGKTYYLRFVLPGGLTCTMTLPRSAVSVSMPVVTNTYTWTGGGTDAINDWFDVNNWNAGGCVPSCATNTDAFIPGGIANQPSIGNATASVRHITLDDASPGASLSFDDPNARLDVCGDFTQNGAIVSNSQGIVEFVGTTGTQTFSRNTNGSGDFNNVLLNNTSGLNLTGILRVGGIFTFQSGMVTTSGANELYITNPATNAIQGHNSTHYVQGNLRRNINSTGSYDFPVGITAKGYELANVNFTSATSIQNLLAKFTLWPGSWPTYNLTDCGWAYDKPAFDHGYWTIDASPSAQSATGNYTLTLYSVGMTNNTSANWTIVKSPSGAGLWAMNGTCAASTASQTTRTGMQGFSDFSIAQSSTPLPVDGMLLSAAPLTNSVRLSWETLQEQENAGFYVQRASPEDGYRYYDIGWVDGKGNSTAPSAYAFEDKNVKPGVVYQYRLRQMDLNGSFRFSNIAEALLPVSDADLAVAFFPNPAITEVTLKVISAQAQPLKLELFDAIGQRVLTRRYEAQPGANNWQLDVSGLAEGTYLAKVLPGNGAEPVLYKLVIIR